MAKGQRRDRTRTESAGFATAVDQLLAAWNDPDPEQRRRRLVAVWSDTSVFAEPGVTVVGLEALLAYLDRLHELAPGYWIRRTSQIFADHGQCAFTWRGDMSGGLQLQGIAHGMLTDDGRLAMVRRAVTHAERVAILEARHPDDAPPSASRDDGT